MARDKRMFMRLAFRKELQWWVCYLAQPETMDGAVEIGRIHFNAVHGRASTREAFMALMRLVYQDTAAELGLPDADLVTIPAPEHERMGEG